MVDKRRGRGYFRTRSSAVGAPVAYLHGGRREVGVSAEPCAE